MNKHILHLIIVPLLLLISAPSFAVIAGINHTKWAINWFTVNGWPGLDGVDPFNAGGGGYGYIPPEKWHKDLTVKVEWETGIFSTKGFPGFADQDKYLKWEKK
ncbi:MAG: DUF3304 domain-containing protein [Vibrio sp.]